MTTAPKEPTSEDLIAKALVSTCPPHTGLLHLLAQRLEEARAAMREIADDVETFDETPMERSIKERLRRELSK